MCNYVVYFLLGCNSKDEFDLLDAKETYRRSQRAIHPDKLKDNPLATMYSASVTKGWEILQDAELRNAYDVYGCEGLEELSLDWQELFDTALYIAENEQTILDREPVLDKGFLLSGRDEPEKARSIDELSDGESYSASRG